MVSRLTFTIKALLTAQPERHLTECSRIVRLTLLHSGSAWEDLMFIVKYTAAIFCAIQSENTCRPSQLGVRELNRYVITSEDGLIYVMSRQVFWQLHHL